MTPIRVELRRGPGLWSLPVLVGVGVFMSRAQLETNMVWAYATGAVTSAPMLMAPLAVGVAAWAGGRSQRRGVRHAWLLAGRDPAQAPLVEAGVLVACASGAYAVVAAVTLFATAPAAAWGGPFWWWLGSAGVGLAAAVAVAYAVGVLLPSRLTPFAAALITYPAATWNLGQYGTGYALFPFTVELILPFSTPHTPTMQGQMLWFTGVGVLALALVAVKVRSSARVVIPSVGAALALAVGGAAIVIGENGRYVDMNRHIVWTCSGSSPQVCVSIPPSPLASTRSTSGHRRSADGCPRRRFRSAGSSSGPGEWAVGLRLVPSPMPWTHPLLSTTTAPALTSPSAPSVSKPAPRDHDATEQLTPWPNCWSLGPLAMSDCSHHATPLIRKPRPAFSTRRRKPSGSGSRRTPTRSAPAP